MVSPGEIYVTAVVILLLAALGASIPVLVGIFRDGLERHRERQSGERRPDIEDETPDRDSAARRRQTATGSTRLACRHCGAANDPEFEYCWRCTERL